MQDLRFSEYFGAWIRAYYANIPLGCDFYTAVSTSRFFGGAIAKYILQQLEVGTLTLPLNIIDLGANSANLLGDIRAFLEVLGLGVAEHCKFIAVEANNVLDSPHNNIYFYKNLAELKNANILQNHNCIFVVNEFFDALPCEIIIENKMAFVENNRLIFKPHNDKKVQEICENFRIHKGEIPLIYDEICDEMAKLKFIFIAFDYGNEKARNDLSLRFFYRHKTQNLSDILADFTQDLAHKSANLAPLFGKCDITYNVPFFLLDSAFKRIGATKIISKRQDLALIEDFNILDLLQDFYDSQSAPNRTYLHESNKIKTLLYELSPKFYTRIYKNF